MSTRAALLWDSATCWETLETFWRHFVSCTSPTGWLQAPRMDWRGMGLPLYKHRLLVNFGDLEQKHMLASIISLAVSFHTALASHSETQLVWTHVATIQEDCCFYANPSWIVIKSRSYSWHRELQRPWDLQFYDFRKSYMEVDTPFHNTVPSHVLGIIIFSLPHSSCFHISSTTNTKSF